MKNSIVLLFITSLWLVFSQCGKDGIDIESNYYAEEDYALLSQYLNIPNVPANYQIKFPDYYGPGRGPSFNTDLATLGKVLFYDVNLSKDRSVSCASCHKQELAFSDDVAFSKGIENRETTRNSLALGSVFSFNEYYGPSSSIRIPFFWDNRAESAMEQAAQTLKNENEMGMDMPTVVERVKDAPYYVPLIQKAFGKTDISAYEILNAISEFTNTIGSVNSRYDQALDVLYAEKGFSFQNHLSNSLDLLTTKENLGKNIYLSNCASCHNNINGAPNVLSANNGLDLVYTDKGIGAISTTNNIGMFKVPTLRNIELTAPYMHDGRFATLEEVVEHYSTGIQDHPNLSQELKTYSEENSQYEPIKFNFTDSEKANLIAFLRTFTDEEFLNKEVYSDPFK